MPVERTVLFVVQNATTLDRLLDVFGVFADDVRVQVRVTSDLTDPFAEGLPEQVGLLGLPAVPWSETVGRRFDLIVSASHHGPLDEVTGPLLVLPHGAGFGKYAPGSRTPFGLAPRWLLRDGAPAAAAYGFPHTDLIDQVAREVPAAMPAAALVGDPTYDALCALPPDPSGDGPVVVTSTWGRHSLLATRPDLPRELVRAGRRVRLVVHPNVWAWHGPFQLRLWYADFLRDGVELVPPVGAWRAALAGAACVIGDHGSVTAYGAALGKPTLLGVFPDGEVVPGSPAYRVGRSAPRLESGVPVGVQVDKVVVEHEPTAYASVAELITSVPGEAGARLRALCYRMLGLAEPC